MRELSIEQIVSDPYTTQTLVKLQGELIDAQQEQLESNVKDLEKAKTLLTEYQDMLAQINDRLHTLIQKLTHEHTTS